MNDKQEREEEDPGHSSSSGLTEVSVTPNYMNELDTRTRQPSEAQKLDPELIRHSFVLELKILQSTFSACASKGNKSYE